VLSPTKIVGDNTNYEQEIVGDHEIVGENTNDQAENTNIAAEKSLCDAAKISSWI
jgi:hypothetical protein